MGIWAGNKVWKPDPKYKKCKLCGRPIKASRGDYGPKCAQKMFWINLEQTHPEMRGEKPAGTVIV